MTAAQVDARAREAIDLMMSIPFDSFGPTDACRELPGFWDLTPDDRERIVLRARALCDE